MSTIGRQTRYVLTRGNSRGTSANSAAIQLQFQYSQSAGEQVLSGLG